MPDVDDIVYSKPDDENVVVTKVYDDGSIDAKTIYNQHGGRPRHLEEWEYE